MKLITISIWGGVAITIVAILAVIAYLVGTLYVYEPLFIEQVNLNPPDTVCAGKEVDVSYTVDIAGGPYTIERTTGILSWVGDQEDARPIGGDYFDRPSAAANGGEWIDSRENVEVPSPIRRLAPTIAGEYYNNTQATVRGKMFGIFPVTQDINYVSEQKIVVLPEDSEQCMDERGGQ